MNIVRTWTEHNEHEHFVHVCVHHLLERNLNVQVQVRAQDPRTRTEPNRGQSMINKEIPSTYVCNSLLMRLVAPTSRGGAVIPKASVDMPYLRGL